MSPDQLNELLRQRAALQAQLDALDRSISTAVADSTAAPATVSPVDSIALSDYEPDSAAIALKTKRGCLLYFCLFLFLGSLVMIAIYFWRYRDRPLLKVSAEQASVFRQSASV